MKRLSVFFMVLTIVVTLGWMAGCRSPESPSVDSELLTRDQTPDLNDPYGGFNLADEAPGFDMPELLAEFGDESDVEYNDPMTDEPNVYRYRHRDKRPLYLMVRWGNLCRDSTIDFVTDWSGSLTVDNGAVLLKRVLRFEPNDRILPRVRRDLLEWNSTTKPHWDGIIVRILPKPSVDSTSTGVTSVDSSQIVISFMTGPLDKRYTLADLPGLDETIRLGDGNAVAFTAIKVLPAPCAQGFLRGIWECNPFGSGGAFYGKWTSVTGRHMGYLRGFYGTNDEGKQLFFGKWIDQSGRFRGILKGQWGKTEEGRGWFHGRWVNRNLRNAGRLKGEWQTNGHCRGNFHGRWAQQCD